MRVSVRVCGWVRREDQMVPASASVARSVIDSPFHCTPTQARSVACHCAPCTRHAASAYPLPSSAVSLAIHPHFLPQAADQPPTSKGAFAFWLIRRFHFASFLDCSCLLTLRFAHKEQEARLALLFRGWLNGCTSR